MSEIKIKRCPTCGHKMMTNRHSFSRSIAELLLKTAEKFMPYEPFHLQRDLELTHNEYNNFQKLQYFNLIGKHYNTQGRRIPGKWELTLKAWRLIRGDAKIEEWVETFNSAIVKRSDKLIGIADTIGTYILPKEYAKQQKSLIGEDKGQAIFEFGKVA